MTSSDLSVPARARVLAPIVDEDVPILDGQTRRVGWIAERLAAGLWHTEDVKVLSRVWDRSELTIRNYAAMASTHLELLTGDIDKIRNLSALRLQLLAHDHETDPNARIKATEILLKLTGDLKGGREEKDSMTTSEREQAIIDSIANPDDTMERLLREAFSRGSDRLRALIVEFAPVNTSGEER